jgi:hypothetical protein
VSAASCLQSGGSVDQMLPNESEGRHGLYKMVKQQVISHKRARDFPRVLVCQGCWIIDHRLASFNSRNLCLTVLEAGSLRSGFHQGLFLLRTVHAPSNLPLPPSCSWFVCILWQFLACGNITSPLSSFFSWCCMYIFVSRFHSYPFVLEDCPVPVHLHHN